MKNKKYCVNCSLYRGIQPLLDGSNGPTCVACNFTGAFALVKCRKINSQGDCQFYKREWWKFWIKE